MNKIQQKRLLNVAKALRESPKPKAFSMELFVYGEVSLDCSTRTLSQREPCGTPACALGHYGARRDLQKQFKIELRQDGSFANLVYNDERAGPVWFDDNRIQAHFGIDEQEALKLFSADGCGGAKTTKKAAQFIERFVAKKVKENA